jgi:hypothetical protein
MSQSAGEWIGRPITIYDVLADPSARDEVIYRLASGGFEEDFVLPDAGPLTVGGSHSHGAVVMRITSGEAVFVKRSDRHAVHRDVELGEEGLTWVRNEVAAYIVGEVTGVTSILIPTVHRTALNEKGEHIEVAVSLFVEAADALSDDLSEGTWPGEVDDDELVQAAVFDFVVRQTDRKAVGTHGGNWFVLRLPDGTPRLLLFDHQLCFDARPDWEPQSIFQERWGHLAAARRYAEQAAALLSEDATNRLAPYLAPEALRNLQARVRSLST